MHKMHHLFWIEASGTIWLSFSDCMLRINLEQDHNVITADLFSYSSRRE